LALAWESGEAFVEDLTETLSTTTGGSCRREKRTCLRMLVVFTTITVLQNKTHILVTVFSRLQARKVNHFFLLQVFLLVESASSSSTFGLLLVKGASSRVEGMSES
jgi:hypothetical protein